MKYVRCTFAVFAVALGVGCAGGQGSPFEGEAARGVELVVHNRLSVTVTAYVEWRNSSPLRLAEVGPGDRVSFFQDIRGSEVRVVASSLGRGGGSERAPGFASVRPGDRIEWVLTSSGPRPYQRLEPVN